LHRNALALILAAWCGAAARQPATPADVWEWRAARDPQIAADGSRVVWVESWSDRGGNAIYSNLWSASSDGRERRRLTEGNWRDRSPRWSSDAVRIAWLSDRGGKTKIWMRRLDTGSEAALDTGEAMPLAFAWSPDGKRIAFTARVAPGAAPAWSPADLLSLVEKPAARVQVFVAPSSGGSARLLSSAALDFSGEPAWMPNGQSIVCAERGGEIFAMRVIDGVVKELTRTGDRNADPLPSPDGSKIAFTTAAGGPHSYAVRKLAVMNADGTHIRVLAGALDRDARHAQWSNESRTVYFIADDRGATHVYAARNDGSVRQLTDRAERLQGFSLADNGRAATVRSSATEGSAVFTFATDVPAGGWTIVDADQQFLAERNWGAVEELPFQSAGRTMQAWLVKPPEFDAARKYPLLVDLAEAPARMRGSEFPLRAHIFAARGWVVLLVNPRGTPGYGQEFGDLLATQVPGDPADDVLRAVDRAAATGAIDPQRVAVVGGTTAAWLLGHSDRFRAVVTRRPVVDWLTFPDAPRWMRVFPWDDPELYWKHSPIFFAPAFKAPTLVIAGQRDSQSEELYRALQARHVDSAIVKLGDGPAADVQEMEAALAWVRQAVPPARF
jgi:dipeptidyl aminopeptidase/acylaminoacyl peptidase